MLSIESVSKSFGGLRAIHNVSLTVEDGAILALIGPNGAGKTTLFNLITGVYKVDQGVVRYDDVVLSGLKPHVVVSRGVSRTFQNIRLFRQMTVLENVLIGQHWRANSGLKGLIPLYQRGRDKQLRGEVDEILESLGLADKSNIFAGELSYGQQRRVEIARAMATKARLLLLDEPAAGMNEQETETLAEDIRRIRDRGHTIFLVEHEMTLVMEISDRVAVLNFGEKIAEGTPREIQQNPLVVEAYLGKED